MAFLTPSWIATLPNLLRFYTSSLTDGKMNIQPKQIHSHIHIRMNLYIYGIRMCCMFNAIYYVKTTLEPKPEPKFEWNGTRLPLTWLSFILLSLPLKCICVFVCVITCCNKSDIWISLWSLIALQQQNETIFTNKCGNETMRVHSQKQRQLECSTSM